MNLTQIAVISTTSWEEPPTPEARGGGPEEPPRARGQVWRPGGATQGAVAARAQEGLEELSQVEDQEGRR